MKHRSSLAHALVPALTGLLVATPARAASLQPVSDWGAAGMPPDVSMYIYVPDNVATNPPILTLVHYCGGTADAVFGQARGGGIVDAADQYGFIMVVPSSGRCWDVVSDKTFTRDGGGDSHAIRQMVEHAVSRYGGNANRVYATGDSSGGMMTELLLALYPEVFKAGASFAGMPAGCRGTGESGDGGGYSGACAGGNVAHTPEEWGAIVRGMYPGYTGYRPRVQLFHGDADDIIRYPNHTEAIKQWTNVLGLNAAPTSTDAVQLGNHSGTRQSWRNACGDVVLDAFTSNEGDHGPSDTLFVAEYVVPFLGLDRTGPADPVVERCGDGTGGAAGTGNAGGTQAAGTPGIGGAAAGGTPPVGGTSGAGGLRATGGSSVVGGAVSIGGFVATGGLPAHAGSKTIGGATGGEVAAGEPTGEGGNSTDGGGCDCRVSGRSRPNWVAAVGILIGVRRLRRRRGVRRRD